jgi:transcriptional regulator with XRE-family HTH domain
MSTTLNVEALKSAMFRKGLNRESLARLANVSKPTLTRIFAHQSVSETSALKVALAIEKAPDVIDPALLERRSA